MKIELLDLTVRELVEDYSDDGEGGVTGYGGKLDIRPPFQREFIYKDKERNAIIDSILKGFPLNVMYWSDRENGDAHVKYLVQQKPSFGEFSQETDGLFFVVFALFFT